MATVFKGRVFSIDVEKRRFPNGREHEVQIVRHGPSVVLIPVDGDGHLVLIRQYRPSVDRELWEFPAGRVDAGESPEDAARRECEEEIGLVPHQIAKLGGWYPVPGYSDEELIFFRVWNLRQPPPDSTHKPDEDEDIFTRPVTIDEARAMLSRGEIVDLKTAFALTLV